jgi:hypothetical protein
MTSALAVPRIVSAPAVPRIVFAPAAATSVSATTPAARKTPIPLLRTTGIMRHARMDYK